MEDSDFIKVLEYGEKMGIDGTTMPDFWKWAKNIGVDHGSDNIHETLKVKALQSILDECFDRSSAREDNAGEKKSDYRLVLKTKYYFRLIEYRELQVSRTAARSANKTAFLAIGIALISIIVSGILTFAQLNEPASISKSDLNALVRSNMENGTAVKLDSLQMAQILAAIDVNRNPQAPRRKSSSGQSKEVSHHEFINQYFEDQ